MERKRPTGSEVDRVIETRGKVATSAQSERKIVGVQWPEDVKWTIQEHDWIE